MTAMETDSLQDIAVLIDALRSDRDSLRQLQRIADALGQARTRDELIPYVSEAQEDDDEYILVLAEELGNLLSRVGGSEHAGVLLAPLETLAASDETAVRSAVVTSMQTVINGMTAADVESTFLPLLTRLATGCYPTRVAACDLYANVHPVVTRQEQVRLRSEFENLTSDAHPVVRRSAAANLARLASAAGQEHIEFFLKLFVKISQDSHESTRRVLVEHAAEFARCCTLKPGLCEELVPNVITLLHDPSWRVRFCAASHVHRLAEAFGQEVTRRDLFPHYRQLLQDKDGDVRGPACQALATVCKHLDISVITQSVRPCLLDLSKDSSDRVRELLANHLIELAPIFGRQHTLNLLLEPMLTLMRDKNADVRLNVLRTLHNLSDFVTLDQVSEALLPTLDELAGDRSWRVRHQLVALTPTLGEHLGMAFFQRDLLGRVLQWLTDSAAIIRAEAATALCAVAAVFGEGWTKDHVLDRVVEMVGNPNYLHRMSVLYCLRDLCKALGPEEARSRVVPVIVQASADPVPNIRFVAAKVLQQLQPMMGLQALQSDAMPCLQTLQKDGDADVRFYADLAVQELSGGSAVAVA